MNKIQNNTIPKPIKKITNDTERKSTPTCREVFACRIAAKTRGYCLS